MNFFKKNLAQLALLLATVATLVSLYFSEIEHLTPCTLCWYQRIFMYPLVIIISISIWKKDKNLPYIVLPLSVIGIIIAAYHNLLYYKIIPENLTPCTLGISCTTRQVEWLGFITIPLLSLLAFISITILMATYKKIQTNK